MAIDPSHGYILVQHSFDFSLLPEGQNLWPLRDSVIHIPTKKKGNCGVSFETMVCKVSDIGDRTLPCGTAVLLLRQSEIIIKCDVVESIQKENLEPFNELGLTSGSIIVSPLGGYQACAIVHV